MAFVFSKVPIRGQKDYATIERLMDEAMNKFLQSKGEDVPQELLAAIKASTASSLKDLSHLLHCNDGWSQEIAPVSPLLQPLSPIHVDAELKRLEASVNEASERLVKLRIDMQDRLKQEVASKLAACRPAADADDALPPLDPQAQVSKTDQREPSHPGECPENTEEMQEKLIAAVGSLPTLRARLEEAQERLQRVAREVVGEKYVTATPYGSKAKELDSSMKIESKKDDDEPDPAVLIALESGKISTRRKTGQFKSLSKEELDQVRQHQDH